jgi:hypothetical protein
MFENQYHYSVGDKKTFNKLQAIVWASQSHDHIKFHLPEWLQKLPIHIEPEQSMKELCVRRAKQLREDYDHLRLWFSGGIDSTYMLDIFVDNKIHVDEIITVSCGIPEADWEIEKVAIPYLESIKDKIPNTQVNIQKPTMQDYADWYKDEYWFENYEDIGRSEGFSALRLNRKLQSIDLYQNNKNTANVWGLDKPFLNFVKGEWYAFTLDVTGDYQLGSRTNTNHMFYSDDPLIFTKQCHMLKRAIISGIPDRSEYNKVCLSTEYQALWNGSIGRNVKHQKFIIKNTNSIKGHEGLNYKESLAHRFISENYPSIYKNFKNGIANLNNIDKAKWFNRNDARHGDMGVFADFKCIDRNSTKTVDDLYPNGFKIQ